MYALPFTPHSALRIPQMWGMEGFVRQRPSRAVTVHRPPSTVPSALARLLFQARPLQSPATGPP
jgi:hypothetical protein